MENTSGLILTGAVDNYSLGCLTSLHELDCGVYASLDVKLVDTKCSIRFPVVPNPLPHAS